MIKELVQYTNKSTTFNVTRGRIDAIRNKDITASGCRIYDGEHLGVAGRMGQPDERTWREAEENLALGIPYPFEPETGVRLRDLREGDFDPEVFLDQAEHLLGRLRGEFPDFVFSNKISCDENTAKIWNERGLDLVNVDRFYSVSLSVKAAESASIYDTWVGDSRRVFDEDAMLPAAAQQLSAFRNRVELPNGDCLTVAITPGALTGKFTEALNGRLLGLGSSIFNGKMDTALFSDKLSVMLDRRALENLKYFFDAEGMFLPDDKIYLIEKGVIRRGYTDRDTARRYHMKRTASGIAAYDNVPTLGGNGLTVELSDKTAAELLGGGPCVLIAMAAGGSWTNDGRFATPVQLAYLVEDGRLVGRLPEFGVSSNLYDMFGKNFAGVSADKPWLCDHQLITHMEVLRK